MDSQIGCNVIQASKLWELVMDGYELTNFEWRVIQSLLELLPKVGDDVLRYTTNAIESLNAKLRRAVRTRGHFPSDEAATKLLYLDSNHAAAEWKRPPREWFEAKTQFAVVFGERFVNQ